MKVLYISNFPGPPFDGGNVHIFNILKRLNQIEIYLLYYLKPNDKKNIETLKELGINYKLAQEIKSQKPFTPYYRIKSLFSKYPYVKYFESTLGNQLRNQIDSIINKYNIDLIHLWLVGLAYSLRTVSNIPKILTVGDAFSLMHESLSRTTNFPENLYHKILSFQFKKYEKEIYPRYQALVFFTERDKHYVNIQSNIKQYVIPNGVDLSIFKPSKNKKENNVPILLFHGNFEGTNSNREAAHFIVNKIYPSLRKKLGDAFEIQIIGKGCEKLLNEVKFKNIKIISYADKIEKLLSRGDIYVAPIFSGSGMKNKILEAMAVGLPVIGTAEAFMGIEAENLVHCIKVNDTEEFVSSIINLINDKELRRAIGYRAFSLVKKNFSWDSIVVKYISLYEELLKNNKK